MDGELARRIVVRHREAGYLRLELPAAICHAAAGVALEEAMRAVGGVYRAEFQGAVRRLVIAYDERFCSAAEIGRALKSALAGLPPPAAGAHETQACGPELPAAVHEAARRARQVFDDLRARVERLRTPQAASGGLQARLQPVLANAFTEKAITNFLNDLIAFYLVRVHWQLITQRWLKQPLKHADAWLAVFYLMFLLVRYRKSLAPRPALQPQVPASQEPAAQ